MKSTFCLLLVAAVAAISFSSCKKDMPGRHNGNNNVVASSTVLNVSVQAGNAYKLNLSAYGNGSTSIAKQAASYTVSEITYSNASRSYVYTYNSSASPKAGETFTDKVILKITNSANEGIMVGGCTGNYDNEEKNITINFTVN